MKSIQIFGHGAPLVLVPGIQGRWEYMRPTIDALAASFQVITFPLCGEPASGRRFEPGKGLDNFVEQLDAVLDECRVESAAICGISFGGLIALHYAAQRPERASALILASTPGPAFQLRKRHQVYARVPLIFGPLFLAEMPRRVGHELTVVMPRRRDRLRFGWTQVRTFLGAPVSASRMAERATMLGAEMLRDDCARVTAPTLVVTGEPALDYVVPVGGTSEYATLIPGARAARIDRTGHLGYITRPELFATLVRTFILENVSISRGDPTPARAAGASPDGALSRPGEGCSPHAA